jgi:hypothetical protein
MIVLRSAVCQTAAYDFVTGMTGTWSDDPRWCFSDGGASLESRPHAVASIGATQRTIVRVRYDRQELASIRPLAIQFRIGNA